MKPQWSALSSRVEAAAVRQPSSSDLLLQRQSHGSYKFRSPYCNRINCIDHVRMFTSMLISEGQVELFAARMPPSTG